MYSIPATSAKINSQEKSNSFFMNYNIVSIRIFDVCNVCRLGYIECAAETNLPQKQPPQIKPPPEWVFAYT